MQTCRSEGLGQQTTLIFEGSSSLSQVSHASVPRHNRRSEGVKGMWDSKRCPTAVKAQVRGGVPGVPPLGVRGWDTGPRPLGVGVHPTCDPESLR